MDGWILLAALAGSALALGALYVWWGPIWNSYLRKRPLEAPDFTENVNSTQTFSYIWLIFTAMLEMLIASAWVRVTGFHWDIAVAFVWPFAAGYAWYSVPARSFLKRRHVVAICFAIIVTLLALGSLVAVIGTSWTLHSAFSTALLTLGPGTASGHAVITGSALLGIGGSILLAGGYAWYLFSARRTLTRAAVLVGCSILVVALLGWNACVAVLDASSRFHSALNTVLITFGSLTGSDRPVITGFALLGAGGLILTVTFIPYLLVEIGRNTTASIEKRKVEERARKERALISDETIRAALIQQLDQGKTASQALFPDVSSIRIRNAMAALEKELVSVALTYDAIATTLAYRNAEGVRRLHEACSEIAQKVTATDGSSNGASAAECKGAAHELVQLFLTELGLPNTLSDADIQVRDSYFAISSGRTEGAIRGVPTEFPIFIPMLNEQQMRGGNIRERFQELFHAEALTLDSRFGLVLSPNSSPFLRSQLTQIGEPGVKENVAYLDEAAMRSIITSKNQEPRTAFLKSVGKQVRFTAVTPFYTRGTTPGVAFVGRDREVSDIVQNIASRSYVILGARRIGKTSMITQTISQLQRLGYRVLYLDCQTAENYQGFFNNIRLRWAKLLGDRAFTDHGPGAFEELVSSLSRSAQSHLPTVFIFDEIDRLLKFDMDQVNPEPLFRTFRALSQQRVCQFIFSGERRIYKQLDDAQSPLFNFPIPIKLGLLSKSDAHKLIEEPLTDFGIKLDGGYALADSIVDACSRHPNLLQEMGHRIFELIDQQPGQSDPVVTQEIVLQVKNQPEFIKLYKDVFLSQSTPLEEMITILVPTEGCTGPSEIASRLKQRGFKVRQRQIEAALEYLTLICIFQREGEGITWLATHFKEALRKAISDEEDYLDDLWDEFSGGASS